MTSIMIPTVRQVLEPQQPGLLLMGRLDWELVTQESSAMVDKAVITTSWG